MLELACQEQKAQVQAREPVRALALVQVLVLALGPVQEREAALEPEPERAQEKVQALAQAQEPEQPQEPGLVIYLARVLALEKEQEKTQVVLWEEYPQPDLEVKEPEKVVVAAVVLEEVSQQHTLLQLPLLLA